MGQPDPSVAAKQLLRINVGAEIAKIAEAQLEGPWQLPAELARMGIRLGARAIDIRLGRRQVDVNLTGADLPRRRLNRLSTLFDRKAGDAVRHAALVELEQDGESALLGLLALDPKEIRIETASGCSFAYHRGTAPRIGETTPGPVTTVHVRLRRFDVRRSSFWIRTVCRFAHIPIALGGIKITTSLDKPLSSAVLLPPHKGTIGIPATGDTATAHLLQHGVVTSQLAVPGVPCFQVAIEFGDKCLKPAPAQVRALFDAAAPSLAEQAIDLLIHTSFRQANTSEAVRKRLCDLLLRALHNRHRLRELVTVPLFRAYDPDVGVRLVDLLTVRSWIRRERDGSMVLAAVFPQGMASTITSRPVAVLDESERSSLGNLLNVRFQMPERRPGAWGLERIRVGEQLRRTWEVLWYALRHPGASRPLPDEALQPEELRLLEALRRQAPSMPVEVRMCRGGGPIRRRGGERRRVLLPRENADVRTCIAALERDGGWAYPSAYLLLERHAKPARELRVRWHERMPQGR